MGWEHIVNFKYCKLPKSLLPAVSTRVGRPPDILAALGVGAQITAPDRRPIWEVTRMKTDWLVPKPSKLTIFKSIHRQLYCAVCKTVRLTALAPDNSCRCLERYEHRLSEGEES